MVSKFGYFLTIFQTRWHFAIELRSVGCGNQAVHNSEYTGNEIDKKFTDIMERASQLPNYKGNY